MHRLLIVVARPRCCLGLRRPGAVVILRPLEGDTAHFVFLRAGGVVSPITTRSPLDFAAAFAFVRAGFPASAVATTRSSPCRVDAPASIEATLLICFGAHSS